MRVVPSSADADGAMAGDAARDVYGAMVIKCGDNTMDDRHGNQGARAVVNQDPVGFPGKNGKAGS